MAIVVPNLRRKVWLIINVVSYMATIRLSAITAARFFPEHSRYTRERIPDPDGFF
jgi:hypothetical protein